MLLVQEHSVTMSLLFYVAHYKQSGLIAIPDDLTCTSVPQRWCTSREKDCKQNHQGTTVWVKKPQQGANSSKFIKRILFSPAAMYPIITYEHLRDLHPKLEEVNRSEMVPCKFGNVPKASVLSH